MSGSITYRYPAPSVIVNNADAEELLLAGYSEIIKKEAPCYFFGKLMRPNITARCLITLANVVKSDFRPITAAQLEALRDPVVTAGSGFVRFEGFSNCAGAYARVDIQPDGHNGEFPEPGTTNVDFNVAMISALAAMGKNGDVVLSVGKREVGIHYGGQSVVERKVPLPEKWLKAFTSVPVYQSESQLFYRSDRPRALQLFSSIPKGIVKTDYYLTMRGNTALFSPARIQGSVVIGGIHRLRLLDRLVPFADELRVYAHPSMQATVWELHLGPVRFSLTLSRDCRRGFSGEGAVLDSLTDDITPELIPAMDNFCYVNQMFNPTEFAAGQGIRQCDTVTLSGRLAAMGLLGFDMDSHSYFYRRLPFKTERIMKLNPRMASAEKLIDDNKVNIVSLDNNRAEARVESSNGLWHTVIIDRTDGTGRCTCKWFADNQGERGACKHILAVKKLINNILI